MAANVRRFVQGCRECPVSKGAHHLPKGKLLPLPIPTIHVHCLGWIMDLAPSSGYTYSWWSIDSLYHVLCIPLKGLPTPMESAKLLFRHVLRYYGILEDIVSDRGARLISRVWKAFFFLLGVIMSLSLGYNPSLMGKQNVRTKRSGEIHPSSACLFTRKATGSAQSTQSTPESHTATKDQH